MADRYSAKVGEAFTLDAKFTLDGVSTDVADVSQVEIQDVDSNVLETITTITHVSTGLYRVTVPALSQGGTLYDVWTYEPIDGADDELLTLTVEVATLDGAAGETADEEDAPGTVCTVTATFLDASGNGVEGVHVRITPIVLSEQFLSAGVVARDIDGQSDEDGAFSVQVLRGLTCRVAVSGLGLVREVTIPDDATVDLFDLVSDAPDLLEVQETEFVELPRLS